DLSKLYKTGDRVRYRLDGSLEFLGRFDQQIKIRGFRIETGEIETALSQHPVVQEAVVIAYGEGTDKQLVAYVVANDDAPDNTSGDISDETSENSLSAQLRHDLAERLPAYLIPIGWVTLETLPKLPNGKIDRRGLPHPERQASQAYVAPRSELEKTLATVWGDVLNQEKVGIHDNFFELGGHSLLAIQIVAQAEAALQSKIPLQAFFKAPSISELAQYLSRRSEDATITENRTSQPINRPQITPDLDQRYEPFPLTDIQQAYWVGRSQAFELGNIGTHGYRELEVDGLSIEQVEQALNVLIKRHDMLRAVVNPDGLQRILPAVPNYEIPVSDCRQGVEDEQLAALRSRLSHQVFTPEQWPLFHIEAAQLPNNKVRFFVSFDVLIGDAWSFQRLGQEMAQLIRGEALLPLSLSFRDYVMAEQAFQTTPAYEQSLEYWKNRLTTLPPAPSLPLTIAPSQVKTPRFERRSGRLEADDWARLKQRAYQAALTPSGVVLAAFSEVLTIWSQQPQFTLNLTLFNRVPLHPEINQIVGDFTASMLLAVDNSGNESFIARAKRLQAQLWEDLDNRAVSGVRILRELAKVKAAGQKGTGAPMGALMPVVFTSTLNQAIPQPESREWQTENVFSVSQTSQVYLDHQVSEIAGTLVFNWDAIADLFPENLLNEMFTAYAQLLRQLAVDDSVWQTLPKLASTEHVQALNQTNQAFSEGELCLHELFFNQDEKQPDYSAVITPEKTLTYGELAARARALAHQLKQLAIQPNHLIAVSIEKGWQQVVAVLGILSAGAAYVPIDPTLPQERRWHLITESSAEIVLTASGNILDWPTGLTQICINEEPSIKPSVEAEVQHIDFTAETLQSPTDLAYVIYTSGSTGTPKGVMIDHRGAVNTILDINQRFEIGPRDRIFALSSLSFDLSVFDIFGTLAAGAALVMPSAQQAKNPTHWRQLLTEHNVTVWNSVPALMQLLTTELTAIENSSAKEGAKEEDAKEASNAPSALRLVLLSGD
ncbi:MAG: AMP-binding protein, partial [Cyanobacteria bacterium J06635_11]